MISFLLLTSFTMISLTLGKVSLQPGMAAPQGQGSLWAMFADVARKFSTGPGTQQVPTKLSTTAFSYSHLAEAMHDASRRWCTSDSR